MEIKVQLNNLRIAPQKSRMVVDLIRGKKALEAQTILTFTTNRSAKPILKLLNSALAAARNDFKLDESNLFVSKVTADEGPKLKRFHPMSRGRAFQILKRTSHIALTLGELSVSAKKAKGSTETVTAETKDVPEKKKTKTKSPATKTRAVKKKA